MQVDVRVRIKSFTIQFGPPDLKASAPPLCYDYNFFLAFKLADTYSFTRDLKAVRVVLVQDTLKSILSVLVRVGS